MDLCHLKKAQHARHYQKIHGVCGAPEGKRQRRKWIQSCIRWARSISATHGSGTIPGHNFHIFLGMTGEASGAVSAHSGLDGWRSPPPQTVEVTRERVSRNLDRDSSTTKTKSLELHWGSCGSSQTESVRPSTGRSSSGKKCLKKCSCSR